MLTEDVGEVVTVDVNDDVAVEVGVVVGEVTSHEKLPTASSSSAVFVVFNTKSHV